MRYRLALNSDVRRPYFEIVDAQTETTVAFFYDADKAEEYIAFLNTLPAQPAAENSGEPNKTNT